MKRGLILFTACVLSVTLFPFTARAADGDAQEQAEHEAHSQVLLVCAAGEGRDRLAELIRACGKTVDAVSETEQQAGFISDYDFLVTTAREPYRNAVAAGVPVLCLGGRVGPVDGVDTVELENVAVRLRLGEHTQDTFLREARFIRAAGKNAGTYGQLEVSEGREFPFAVISPGVLYVPWYGEDGLASVMMGGLMKEFFGGGGGNGRMYVLLDEIYAFSDLDMLRKSSEAFHENGIPFLVRVMPIYDNLDYPAFQRFTQALLYAQSKGGSIVLHDALVREKETESEPLEVKLERAREAFAEGGITLLDMSVPPVKLTMDDILAMKSTRLNFGDLPVNTMISFSLFESEEELNLAVDEINAQWLSLSSYKANFSVPNSVYTEKEIDADYIFRGQEQASLQSFFAGANRILLILVGVCVAAFTILLMIGRSIYKRRFYKGQGGER